MIKRLALAVVFLAGCAVGGVSSQLVVPKASAQQANQAQASALKKWEMVCSDVNGTNDVIAERATKLGNAVGLERWEPLGVSDGIACFKRPKL